jgi:hypothetical protein
MKLSEKIKIMLESLNSKKYSDIHDEYDPGGKDIHIHMGIGAGLLAGGAYLAHIHPKTATAVGLLGASKIAVPAFFKYHRNKYEKEKDHINDLRKNPEESSSN